MIPIVCMALNDDEEDKKAFSRLVEKYERKMYREAYKILNDKALAEEALWDGFYNVAVNIKKIHNLPVDKIEAYLIIIIRNSSYRKYNEEKKYREEARFDDNISTPDITEIIKYDKIELASLIDKLDEKYRSVLIYYYYYGNTVREIAKIMGISKSAVSNYLNKAIKLLNDELGR